jgi:hypothetical protein
VGAASPNPDALDFLLTYTSAAPGEQADALKHVQAKTVQVFTGATIVVGLAATAVGRFHGSAIWPLGCALGAYLVVAILTGLVIAPRGLRINRDVTQLWNEHYDSDVCEIKWSLMDDLSSGFEENEGVLKYKNELLLASLVVASIQTLLIVTSLLLSLG